MVPKHLPGLVGFCATLPDPVLLKKQAILFDKVICEGITFHIVNKGVTKTRQNLMEEAKDEYAQKMPELLWLQERGVVAHLQNVLEGSEWQSIFGVFERSINKALVSLDTRTPYQKTKDIAVSVYERSMAIELNKFGIEAVSLSPAPDILPSIVKESPAVQNTTVVQIVLENVPQPDELTDWERILDFRADHESGLRRAELRQWMRKISQGTPTEAEVRDELEVLLARYEKHMHLHRLKTRSGIIETVVVTTGAALENLVKFKFKSLAMLGFDLRRRNIDLLIEESQAPGREVSYLAKAREEFSG